MRSLLCALLLLCLWIPSTWGGDAPLKHRVMFFEYGNTPNRFVEVGVDGTIVREFQPPSIAVIFQVLPNGNLLYAYGGMPTGVMEVNPQGETVWNYVSQCPQVLGCERMKNGNTLVAEQGPCQVVEVNPQGKVVQTTKLKTDQEGYHLQVRNVHKLDNGHILAAHEGDGAIREYTVDGTVVWEYTGVENSGEAIRLPNGNTLIAGATQKRIIEVTPQKEIVWELQASDVPELNLTWVSSLQILKNGHIVAGNFLRGQEGKGAHAFEVTRDKQVVWTFADHDRFKSITTARVVEE